MYPNIGRFRALLSRQSIASRCVVSAAFLMGFGIATDNIRPSHAATMTFNDYGVAVGATDTTHTENGLTMSTTTGHFDIYGNIVGGTLTDNVAAIHTGNGGQQVIFTHVDGPFDLLSIEIKGWLVRGGEDPMTATFDASSGATYTATAPTTGVIDFTLMSGWSNISWFTFTTPFEVVSCDVTCSIVGFDNVAVQTQTPIPAALPLFATGLGALVLLVRRRKQKNASLAT